MLAVVTELPLGEPARFNPERLENLCQQIGETRAEAEVAHALDRIASNLKDLGRPASGAAREALRWRLADLVRDAEMIGMATLARVAQDVLTSDAVGDEVAFHATLARLTRVGDRSIHAVWDLDDLSG